MITAFAPRVAAPTASAAPKPGRGAGDERRSCRRNRAWALSSVTISDLPAARRLFKCQPMSTDPKGLTQLGSPPPIPASPDEAKLERVPNPHAGTLYLVRFTAPEFTSICPVTGQPDFGTLVIDYAPKDWIVESKSLKLFLQSFRNHGAFHEDCTRRRRQARRSKRSARHGCASAATGTRAAACRSTCSGKLARRRKGCGCRTRAWRRTARAARRPR